MSNKVALCFIISYSHILNKEKLWRDWIEPNKDIINVYFHYKDVNMIKSPWILEHSLPPKQIAQTSYYFVVPAYISVLSFAYYQDKSNTWFCLLTDSCVPIISPQKFRQLFFQNCLKSVIKCRPAYWNVEIHKRANLRMLSKEYQLANDPWFTLTRQHVLCCIDFLAKKHSIYKTVCGGGLANESLFAIILQSYKQLDNDRVINESTTVTDWSRMPNPTSPYTFTNDINLQKDIEIITTGLKENKYSMFLRKVDKSFPDEILLDFIYNKDFNPLKKIDATSNNIFVYKVYNLLYIGGLIYLLYCIGFVVVSII
jgi:hypothetical protein